jgi:hypothetical protein
MKSIISIIIGLFLLTDYSLKAQTNDDLVIYGDSIFKLKGYKFVLKRFDLQTDDEFKFNAIFSFSKLINDKYVEIYKDSLFVTVQEIKFDDYNQDNIPDILIQNYSDVRSNWTYYLYLVDNKTDKLTKVNGFEEIKNPRYNSDYGLIENYVMSGRNWTSFYKIKDNKIIDLGITIYDGEDDNGKTTYNEDYIKAINSIKNK